MKRTFRKEVREEKKSEYSFRGEGIFKAANSSSRSASRSPTAFKAINERRRKKKGGRN